MRSIYEERSSGERSRGCRRMHRSMTLKYGIIGRGPLLQPWVLKSPLMSSVNSLPPVLGGVVGTTGIPGVWQDSSALHAI